MLISLNICISYVINMRYEIRKIHFLQNQETYLTKLANYKKITENRWNTHNVPQIAEGSDISLKKILHGMAGA